MSLSEIIKIARSADSRVKGNGSKPTNNASSSSSTRNTNRALVEARRDALSQALYKQFIKLAYEPGDSRVLFYAVRGKTDMNGLASQLNGIILDLVTLKFVCVPSMGFTDEVDGKVKENLDKGEYEVFTILDGTTVNIYYYDKKWHIATAKGISVNSKKWYGISWTSVLKTVFEKFNVKLNGFDKDRTYSFTIQHPKYHPFINDYGLTMISVVNHTKFNETLDNNLRQPIDKTAIPGVNYQRKLRNMNMGKIIKFNKTAIDHFFNTGIKNFGYILRRKDANGPGCDILITSALTNYVIDHVYNVKADTELNRTHYINLYNYLNNDGFYIRMFPQYETDFNDISEKIKSLINRIMDSDPDTRRLESIISTNIQFKDKTSESYRKNLEFMINNKEFTGDIFKYIY